MAQRHGTGPGHGTFSPALTMAPTQRVNDAGAGRYPASPVVDWHRTAVMSGIRTLATMLSGTRVQPVHLDQLTEAPLPRGLRASLMARIAS